MEKTLTVNGRNYRFKKANASRCWVALKDALVLVGKIELTADKENLGVELLKGVLANLGDPAMKKLEELTLSHTNFTDELYWLNERFDEHFNKYPQDLLTVLVEGAKFQFAPFFANGAGLLTNTNG